MAYGTIDKSSSLMNTQIWTGTGSAQSITGVGFQPDFSYIKCRSGGEYWNLTDSVRGVTQNLSTNVNTAQATEAQRITAFDSDGFSLGTNDQTNLSAGTFASWNWKGGTTSGITAGTQTITPSAYSINTTSKFGVYQYTGNDTAGATIAHGLGASPSVIIVKRLDGSGSWMFYHRNAADTGSAAGTKTAYVESTGAFGSGTAVWNSVDQGSTYVTLGDDADINGSGYTFIMYVFCDVKGFCKGGRYIGNGETTAGGTFIYTGFKPSFVLIKNLDATGAWNMNNNKVLGYNNKNYILNPDAAGTENTSYISDIYANGFKPNNSADAEYNASGNKYVYLAVGQSLIGSSGVCATAR